MRLIQQITRITALFLVAFTASINANAAETQCNKPKVFFVNGVLVERVAAWDLAFSLADAITESEPSMAGLTIRPIYNQTDPGLGDAIEVANDAVLSQSYLTLAWWVAFLADIGSQAKTPLVPKVFLTALFYAFGGAGEKSYSAWLEKMISDNKASIRNEAVISNIQQKLLYEVQNNKRPVVVVAHSQGNFYVNKAIQGLKTSVRTRDVPGVQAIGVLGIAVASKLTDNPALLPSGEELYSYVTRDDDVVILPLAALPSNFTDVEQKSNQDRTPLRHELKENYLSPLVRGTYKGAKKVPIRKAVVQEFMKVYSATQHSWPCIDPVEITPNPADANAPVNFKATIKSRAGAVVKTGVVSFEANGVEVCASSVTALGEASCSFTFTQEDEHTKIISKWKYGVFLSESSPNNLVVQGDYRLAFDWGPGWTGDTCQEWDLESHGVVIFAGYECFDRIHAAVKCFGDHFKCSNLRVAVKFAKSTNTTKEVGGPRDPRFDFCANSYGEPPTPDGVFVDDNPIYVEGSDKWHEVGIQSYYGIIELTDPPLTKPKLHIFPGVFRNSPGELPYGVCLLVARKLEFTLSVYDIKTKQYTVRSGGFIYQ